MTHAATPATPPPAGEPAVEPPVIVTMPQIPTSVGVGIVAVIAVVAALYLARAFFVPLLIGILTSYALRPIVDGLKACWIPRPLGAALVLVALIGATCWGMFAMGDDATSVIEKLPDAARKVRQHASDARAGGPTALQKIQEAATELQGAATDATAQKKPATAAAPKLALREAESGVWLRDYVITQSTLLFTVIAQTPIVLLLAYFLLASGEHFRRKLVQWVGPSLSAKKDAVRMLQEIDTQIQRYLLTMLASNVLVAVGTWLAFSWLGVEQAAVWGVTAGVLHFIPYLGPVLFAAASGMAGFMQFDTAAEALTMAGVSLLVAGAVGTFVTTWMQSRLAKLNAAVLFIALLFFGWLWGIWGLLLGAPLIAIAKVICDRVDSLQSVGELLGQ